MQPLSEALVVVMERRGWRKAIAGSSHDLRVVDVVGGTGAGKSTVGNIVTNNRPPPAGAGFKEGTTAESETTEVQTLEATVKLPQTTLGGLSRYKLSWSDTQGICDTGGRTVAFLDHIVEHMKTNPPNGIVLVYNSAEKDTAEAKLGYKAMKLCFNESLPDGRTILVMNKMTPLALLRRSHGEEAAEEYARIYADNLSRVCSALGMEEGGLSNVVPVEMHSLDDPDGHWVKAVHTRIANFPAKPLDCSRFKTFTEVLLTARRFKNDAMDAVTVAEETIADIQSRNANIENDIQWHEARITSMKAAIPLAATGGLTSSVVLGLLSFGIGAAVAGAGTAAAVAGLTAALVDSQHKAPALREKLRANELEIAGIHENKEENLEKEKAKYVAFLTEVEEVESVMTMTVQP